MFSSVVFHGSRLLVRYSIRSREVNPGHGWEWTAPSLVDVVPFFKQGYSIQFQAGLRTPATLIVPHLTWPEHTVHGVVAWQCFHWLCRRERVTLHTLQHTFRAGQGSARAGFYCEFVLCQRRLRRRITAFCTPQQFNKTSWLGEKYSACVWTVHFQKGERRQQEPRPAAPSPPLKGSVLPRQNTGFFIRITCSVYDCDSYGEETAEYFLLFLLPSHIFQSAGLFFLLWFNGKDMLLLVWASQCYETEVMYTQQLMLLQKIDLISLTHLFLNKCFKNPSRH